MAMAFAVRLLCMLFPKTHCLFQQTTALSKKQCSFQRKTMLFVLSKDALSKKFKK